MTIFILMSQTTLQCSIIQWSSTTVGISYAGCFDDVCSTGSC